MNENVEKREAIINPEILPEKLSVIIKEVKEVIILSLIHI